MRTQSIKWHSSASENICQQSNRIGTELRIKELDDLNRVSEFRLIIEFLDLNIIFEDARRYTDSAEYFTFLVFIGPALTLVKKV